MTDETDIEELRSRLGELTLRDRDRFERRLHGLRRISSSARRFAAVDAIATDLSAASALGARRAQAREALGTIRYPNELPISQRHDEILAALRSSQVVVIAGDTGSGKSTQLPKMCLELGRGTKAMIGHTQPRRLAARAVASRIADELGTTLGDAVGYSVRFNDTTSPTTLVRLMTDGLLLAELHDDPDLLAYDTIIVDEAHERSLNVDFLLGYLRRLVQRRDDLSVIVTSATIDTAAFAMHFDDAPVVKVSGRSYPVEIRYRPLDDPDTQGGPRDQPQAIVEAVRELMSEGPGDVLVFCAGEREIRDACDALVAAQLTDTSVLALFSRLSAADQQRTFAPHAGRRVVVATNIAETSLTVPGIHFVVDAGNARISRYNRKTKTQRLPIEPVSQASADQRAGRCGRIAPGIAVRLYGQDDYETRPRFTEPEIQRTNLASVILAMAVLELGDIDDFPFVDPPESSSVRDGVDLLVELGALERGSSATSVTGIGRRIARLPVDPRHARMIVESERLGCLDEVAIIAAGLSIQDPREWPVDDRVRADELHGRFADTNSDFLSLLTLWNHLDEQTRGRSSNRFRRLCRDELLNYNRVREWQDLVRQIHRAMPRRDEAPRPSRQSKRRAGTSADVRLADRQHRDPDTDVIHRALLSGLVSHIGMRDGRSNEYRGARGSRFMIGRESNQRGRSHAWVMAADLVETNRLWARMVGRIDPSWIERAAGDLCRRSFGEPWWDESRGVAMVDERVTVYGLPVVDRRAIPYRRVDRADARAMFIHHALVLGEWRTHHRFVPHNLEVLDEARALAARVRRGDLGNTERARFDFFDRRIDADVTSTQEFDTWWNDHRRDDPNLLDLSIDDLIDSDAAHVDTELFPDVWHADQVDLPLSYEFEPGSPTDGVVVTVPIGTLARVGDNTFEWNVPGVRSDLVTALVRSLPKHVRRELSPIRTTVDAVVDSIDPEQGPLLRALAGELSRRAGAPVSADDFDLERVPTHLRPTFRIVDDDGGVLAQGSDLAELRGLLDAEVRNSVSRVGHELERSGMQTWDLDRLPRTVETEASGHVVEAFPALVDETESVGVKLFATREEQADAMWSGTRRLLRLNVAGATRVLRRLFSNELSLALAVSPYSGPAALFDDVLACCLDALMACSGGPAWDRDGFATLLDSVRRDFDEELLTIGNLAANLLTSNALIVGQLDSLHAANLAHSVADARAHLARLVYPGFLAGVGREHLEDVARYLDAIRYRLERLETRVGRDLVMTTTCTDLEAEYAELVASLPWSAELEAVAWQLEELRVSCFAQPIGAAGPVSEKRIRSAMAALGA